MTNKTNGQFDEILEVYRTKHNGKIGSRAKGPILSHSTRKREGQRKEAERPQPRQKGEAA